MPDLIRFWQIIPDIISYMFYSSSPFKHITTKSDRICLRHNWLWFKLHIYIYIHVVFLALYVTLVWQCVPTVYSVHKMVISSTCTEMACVMLWHTLIETIIENIPYAPVPLSRIYTRTRTNVKSKKFVPILLCLKGQMHKVTFKSTKIVRTLLSST